MTTSHTGRANHSFIVSWQRWKRTGPPFYLSDDEAIVHEMLDSKTAVSHTSWRSYLRDPQFCNPDDTRLHLGLIPQPFCGDPMSARIVVLTLNPGLNPHDYFGEYRVRGFRRALEATLRRTYGGFAFLDQQHSWHSGFTYWFGRLRRSIETAAKGAGCSPQASLAWFARNLSTIELLPYHSEKFHMTGHQLSRFRSTAMARSFVHDVLVPRARRGECALIVTRSVKHWQMGSPSRCKHIVVYPPAHARGARLTPNSPGGKCIADMCRQYRDSFDA